MTGRKSGRSAGRFSILGFMRHEAAGGLILIGVAALALIVANSPWAPAYFGVLHDSLGGLDVLGWIDDGLMALFFLLVGLEIKREVVRGQLSTWSKRALPGIAALGGVAAPAAIYLLVNRNAGTVARGWAIPSATDIAFALGIASLLGRRVPPSLKVMLTALAVIDDLAAVVIIAAFYTSDIAWVPFRAACIVLVMLAGLNLCGVRRLWPYLTLAPLLWAGLFLSGVHATLAGVALAFTIPLPPSRTGSKPGQSALLRLEQALHPIVAFAVVPIFRFANAGIVIPQHLLAVLLRPIPLGIAAGLFVGKQAGVMAASIAAIRLGIADLPAHADWRSFYGVALLCGVGFTMSLFIGALAFPDAALQDETRLGVIAGSGLSGLVGAAVLALRPRQPR